MSLVSNEISPRLAHGVVFNNVFFNKAMLFKSDGS